MKKYIAILFAVLALSGCTRNIQSDVFNEREAFQIQSITRGTIIEVMPVKVQGDKVIGTASGTVVGAVAGSALGGNDHVKVIGGVLGAVAGGKIGQTIDGWITNRGGYQYIIELRNTKEVISIVQGQNNPLAVGDKVILLHNDGKTKVIKDTTE